MLMGFFEESLVVLILQGSLQVANDSHGIFAGPLRGIFAGIPLDSFSFLLLIKTTHRRNKRQPLKFPEDLTWKLSIFIIVSFNFDHFNPN